MIDYQTFEQIRLYADQQGLKVAQIALGQLETQGNNGA